MTDYTAADARAAVACGAAWLDEQCPLWAARINLAKLDMASGTACILGQTAECLIGPTSSRYGGYELVLDAVLPDWFDQVEEDAWAEEHGFNAPSPNDLLASPLVAWSGELRTRYEMLAIAWNDVVRERLAAGVPS